MFEWYYERAIVAFCCGVAAAIPDWPVEFRFLCGGFALFVIGDMAWQTLSRL